MSIPGVSGPEVLAAVKNDPATAEVRVIVVTARGEEGRAAAMAGGADHYFTKPFSPIALLQAVEEVLGPEERHRPSRIPGLRRGRGRAPAPARAGRKNPRCSTP